MASSSQALVTTELASNSSLNATNSRTAQPLGGLTLTDTVSEDSNSGAMSTSQLAGVIAASVVAVLAILVLIHSRRHRYASKLSTPTNCSAFLGVTSLTPSDHLSNKFKASTASTDANTPQPSLSQTFKSSRLSTGEVTGLHVAQEEPVREILPTGRGLQPFRTTSLVRVRSLFSASFLKRGGFRLSLPVLAAFGSSRTSPEDRVNAENELRAMTSPGPTQAVYSSKVSVLTPIEHRNADDGVWRDFSDASWSIGLGSESETESEWFPVLAGPNTHDGAFVLARKQLSMLSDKIMDIEEEEMDFDVSSLDDFSCEDRDTSAMSDFSPRSEQSTSAVGGLSPRRVRGLSAFGGRWKKGNRIDATGTKTSGFPHISDDSDYNGICSLISFDSEPGSDSDGSLHEEEL